MKHILPVLLAPLLLAPALRAAPPVTIDGYAAVVDEHVITVGQVMEMVLPMEEQLRINFSGRELAAKRAAIYSNAVQRLVEQQLIVEEFKKSGGAIPERIIEDRINEIINERFDGNRANFFRALAEQRITLEEWREGIRDRMVAQMLRRQEVTDKIRITPADIHEAYEKQKAARFVTSEKVRVHAIVLKKDSDSEARQQEAVLLRGKILSGENFEEMARKHSSGVKADAGGDWGWIELADWRSELRGAVEKLKPGELSQVVAAGDDYFILRLDERQAAGVQSFDHVRTKIEEELRAAEGERLFNVWMERLRRGHSVRIFEASAN